jgi:hypothetical protein
MLKAEGVPVSSDDEQKVRAARLLFGAKGGLLEMTSVYPGNADAWEALWLADQATYAAGEEELDELSEAQAQAPTDR